MFTYQLSVAGPARHMVAILVCRADYWAGRRCGVEVRGWSDISGQTRNIVHLAGRGNLLLQPGEIGYRFSALWSPVRLTLVCKGGISQTYKKNKHLLLLPKEVWVF